MVPLQVLGGTPREWLTTAAIFLGPGAVAALLWSPFLLAGRLRELFRRLPPTDSVLPTYLLLTVGASLPYVLGTLWALVATTGGSGEATANAMLDVIVPVTLVYAVGIPVVAAEGLPRFGIDWDPADYDVVTWVLLAAGGLWYALLFAVPLFVLALIMAFPA